MIRRGTTLAAAAGLLLASVAIAAVSLDGIKCPLSGAPAKADKAVAYLDGNVYFCCEKCAGKFEGDKDKFAAKANHQLVATKQYEQKACPMSGKPLADGTSIDVAGTKVAFCCMNCKGAAEKKSGDEQIEALFSKKSFEKAKYEKVAAKK